MANTLKNLWASYLSTASIEADPQEKKILSTMLQIEDTIEDEKNSKFKELLSKYADAMDELCSLAEQRAFAEGVRFTANFLIEALCEK